MGEIKGSFGQNNLSEAQTPQESRVVFVFKIVDLDPSSTVSITDYNKMKISLKVLLEVLSERERKEVD